LIPIKLIIEQGWLERLDQTAVLGIFKSHHILLRYEAILDPL